MQKQTPSLQLLSKATASILGWFVVYSCIPQMQGTSSWLWRYNPLLLRLLGEISLSLLCSHSSWSSAVDLALPLHVGRLWASVLLSDRTGLKEQLIQRLWVTQAMGREGYGCRARLRRQRPAWCCTSLRHRVFSQGSCPWITGLWQWWAAEAPGRGGVDSDRACTQVSWWLQQQR